MPKEKIFDTGGLDNDCFIDVGWHRESSTVSIASVNPDGGLRVRYEDEGGKTGGWKDIDAIDPGWFVYLDRDAINQLIRVLRKARDAAFGRDE